MDVPPDLRFHWQTYAPERTRDWREMLSQGERRRMDGFGSEKRQREFLTGRVAARRLLAEQLGRPPEAIALEVADGGAVYLPDEALNVSITHAGPHAVAAIGARRLGVDMEPIIMRRPDLDEFLCGPSEEELLAGWSLPHHEACILCWTLKEATLKAMRTGLRLSPKKVRLSVDLARGSGEARVDGKENWILRFVERENCYLSLAFEAD